MKGLIVVCCLLLSLSVTGQKTLKGIVSDADGGQPIPGASVFLSNTSVGTVANGQGEFTLQIPAGKYDLITSSIGFETGSQTISSTDLPDFITIKLKTKAKELETVIFEPFEKDGWNKWGRFFIENFIGTSAFAKDCILKNKDALKFRHSKKKNVLTAVGFEPLIIENKALGYTIRYQLEDFSFDFKTNYLYYAGYPLFQEMDGGLVKKRRWEDARSKAYRGSMMHFMRSVFRNTIAQESFDVFALKKVFNVEKARVKSVYRNRIKIHSGKATNLAGSGEDSSDYYNKILAQEDYFDVVGKSKLTGDSIAYAVNNVTAGLEFKDHLLIIYKMGTAPSEYRQQYPKSSAAMMSQITLVNQEPIEIQANGSYYQPTNLLSLGYWGWSEKIATMLPFDYQLKE